MILSFIIILILILAAICILSIRKIKTSKNRLWWIAGSLMSGIMALVIALPTLFLLTVPVWSNKTVVEMPLKENQTEMQFVLDPGYYMIATTRDVSESLVDEEGDVYYSLAIPSENLKIEKKRQMDFTMRIASNHGETFNIKHKAHGVLFAKELFPFKSKVRIEIVRNPFP